MSSVEAPCLISSSAHSKFPVSTATSKGENPSALRTFMVVAFSMSTLTQSVRPLATASWSGKIPFVASDCKSASPIFISLKSSGSSLPLSSALWSSISGQDDFLLRILLTSTRLLSVSDTLALFVFLRGSLVLFFSRFSGLSCFEDLLFFCVFLRGIMLPMVVFSATLLKVAPKCIFVHL